MTEKENQNIEWKSSWKDEYLKWICGYANAQGGTLYIGTDDDGNVVGIDNAKDMLEKARDGKYVGLVGKNYTIEDMEF